MARKFKFCLHCRRTITESMVARGEFVKTRYGMLCADCAVQLAEEPEAEAPAPAAEAPSAPLPPAPEPEPPPVEPPSPPKAPPVVKREPPPAPVPEAPPEKREPETAQQAPVIEADSGNVLADIRQHVEAIRRALMFEKSSPWTVIAMVVQSLAIGVVAIAVFFQWLDNPLNLLVLGLILQVMALTFFVKGK